VYQLEVETEPPFSCWISNEYARDFPDWKTAFEILTERVNTVSRQFGFERIYLKQWELIQ